MHSCVRRFARYVQPRVSRGVSLVRRDEVSSAVPRHLRAHFALRTRLRSNLPRQRFLPNLQQEVRNVVPAQVNDLIV